MREQPINIAISLWDDGSEKYVMATAVLYVSIRTRTKAPLTFYIFHDETLEEGSREKLGTFIRELDEVIFIDLNDYSAIKKTCDMHAEDRYSPAILWRLFFPEIIQEDKVLLCDADLIVLFDLRDVWEKELGNHLFYATLRRRPHIAEYHAIIRTPPEKYFRTGFSVMNLKGIRENPHYRDELSSFLINRLPKANKLMCLPDQSVLNFFFSSRCLAMDVHIPQIAHISPRKRNDPTTKLYQKIYVGQPTVLDTKGWEIDAPHDFFFWSYLLLTPWREEAVKRLSGKIIRKERISFLRRLKRQSLKLFQH